MVAGRYDNILALAEKAGQLADTLSGLLVLVFPAAAKIKPEDISVMPQDLSRSLPELTEQLERTASTVFGFAEVIPKIIQLDKETNPGAKPLLNAATERRLICHF